MPKSKPSRRGRRGRRPLERPVAQQPARVVAQPVAIDAPEESPVRTGRTRSGRTTRRDYSYVRRDIRRMLVLTVAILVTIVVLSFFLP